MKLLGWRLVRDRELQSLNARINLLAQGDFTRGVPPVDAELADVSAAIVDLRNELAAQVTSLNRERCALRNMLIYLLSHHSQEQREQFDTLRTDFVVAASHELKTPVAGIELLGETACLALSDGDITAAHDFIAQLRSEAAKLRHLVGDLLNLSRLEESKLQDENNSDLLRTLDSALVAHQRIAQSKGLTLKCKIEEDIELSGELLVQAAAVDVAIVLDNLLDNAIAYTDHGEICVTVTRNKNTIAVSVADSGIGFEAKDAERIFERFYRTDKSRSKESGGTGLGLALVKHAVERWGGTIQVSSTPNQGSTFTVTLPLKTPCPLPGA